MVFIKDKNSNILKTFCYNYQGQTVDCVTAVAVPIPTTPTGLAFGSATTSSINFSWNAVAGATGYKIYKNGVYMSSTTATSGALSGLIASTSYNIQVLAYNASGDGSLSAIVAMSTDSASTTDACSINFNRVSGTCTLYKNGSSYLTRSTSGTSNGTLTTGDTFYVTVSASAIYYKNLTIISSVRGVLFTTSNYQGSPLNSGTFTKIGSEIITVDCITLWAD